MRPLAIALAILAMVINIKTEDTGILDDILVYPIPEPMKIQKRESAKDVPDNFNEFTVEKLTQHTQALEHIVKKMDNQEIMFKQLIENLSKTVAKPKLPVHIEPKKEIIQKHRRSNSNDDDNENPILKLGKNLPIYGRLAKDLFLQEIQTDTDPTPLIDKKPDEQSVIEFTRRSFGGSPNVNPSQQNTAELNSWCEAAMLCKKNSESLCGFDDSYGYGKFDDICHMLHVNCYYKFNFVLVHTCNPTI